MEERYDKIRQELLFYYGQSKAVHITTTKNFWYNGKIVKVLETSVILNDRIQGIKILFFEDIKSVDSFKEVKDE